MACELIEAKLLCRHHSTDEAKRWCWVDCEFRHIPIFPYDISVWADYMVLFFNILLDCAAPNVFTTQIASSLTVVELPDTDHFADLHILQLPRPLGWPLTCQHAILIPLDPPPPNNWDIKSALAVLHTIYPALHYPRYEAIMRMKGVNELVDALQFSATFYVTEVGMDHGAAYLFCKWVAEDGNILCCRK